MDTEVFRERVGVVADLSSKSASRVGSGGRCFFAFFLFQLDEAFSMSGIDLRMLKVVDDEKFESFDGLVLWSCSVFLWTCDGEYASFVVLGDVLMVLALHEC